jgi:hypothetical protein
MLRSDRFLKGTLRRVPRHGPLGVAAVYLACGSSTSGASKGDASPQDAQTASFKTYEVVGIGNPAHGDKDLDDFILALIRNPSLPGTVSDIAVECGNSLYQSVLDQYIAGQDVPLSQVRPVWRNTTQPSCGTSGFYEELFPLVQRINRRLPDNQKLRVLACDPPIDWSKVASPADLQQFTNRDGSIASVMQNEVLSKHRRALMLFGVAHLFHGTETGSAVSMYESQYPGSTYVITEHVGFGDFTSLAKDNDQLEARLVSWPVPSLASVSGTWLATLDVGYFFQQESGSSVGAFLDGYLYLGPRDLILGSLIPAEIVLDSAYMTELGQRAAVTNMRNGPGSPSTITQWASSSEMFYYDPDAGGLGSGIPGDAAAATEDSGSPIDAGAD